MIDRDVIDKTILELEGHDTTYATMEKLAMLYTVRDHVSPVKTERISTRGGTELLDAVAGKKPDDVWGIINEHMEAVKALYPREYDAVIRKLNLLVVNWS